MISSYPLFLGIRLAEMSSIPTSIISTAREVYEQMQQYQVNTLHNIILLLLQNISDVVMESYSIVKLYKPTSGLACVYCEFLQSFVDSHG